MSRKKLIGIACVLGLIGWVFASSDQAEVLVDPGGGGAVFDPYQGYGYLGGGSPADPYMGGNFYGNHHLGTAVSSSGGSGYIALGDGNFVSW